MKARASANALGLGLYETATLALELLQFVEGRKCAIEQRRIGQRPKALGRLEFRRVGGQEGQGDALRHLKIGAGMPPRIVEHEQDMMIGTSPHLTRKGCQDLREARSVDGGHQQPTGGTRRRTDKAIEIEPFIPLMHRRDGTGSSSCPHPPPERFEANTMFIERPERQRYPWVNGLHLPNDVGQFF